MKKIKLILSGLIGVCFGVALSFVLTSCGEKADTETCEHVFKTKEIEVATCTSTGKVVEYCEKCGYEKDPTITPVDPANHNPESSELAKSKNDESKAAVGCGEEYDTYGVCSYCNEIVKMGTAIKEAHKYEDETYWYEIIDDESHYYCVGYRCTICNEINEAMTTKTKQYHNAEIKHESDPEKALTEGLCSYYHNECTCGQVYDVALQHNYNNGEYSKTPTCTEGGVLVKTCQNPDCTDPYLIKDVSALGHAFNVEVAKADCIERTCERCHELIAATGEHEYQYDADCYDRVCLKCNQLIVAKSSDHVYADNYSCHNRVCVLCHSVESTIYATTDHLLAETTNTRKDCTDPDEVYYRVCDICHDSIAFKYNSSYTSHTFDITVVYNPATCESEGYRLMRCSHCETTEETYISASAHNDVLVEDVSPTCTTDGYQIYQCTNCKRQTKKVLAMLGHTYSDPYTCHDRQCLVCGETCWHTTEHTYELGSTVCTVCGESIILSTPVISYNKTLYKIEAEVQTLNTVFYIDGEEFNGNLTGVTLTPGIHVITARNVDTDQPAKNSEYSDPVYVFLLPNDAFSSANVVKKNSNGITTVKITTPTMTIDYGYTINFSLLDENGDAISDSSGKSTWTLNVAPEDAAAGKVLSANISSKAAKIVITIASKDSSVVMFKDYTYEIAL